MAARVWSLVFSHWSLDRKKGFTLIELMVVISIIAILAAVGITAYSKTQIGARDSRRKQDLKEIQVALEAYFQKNGKYPDSSCCGGATGWVNSTSSSNPWIPGVDSNFISTQPLDPKNSCSSANGNPRDTASCYVYAYFSAGWGNLNSTDEGYILTTRLENASDPDAGKPAVVGANHDLNWPDPPGGGSPCSYCYTLGNP